MNTLTFQADRVTRASPGLARGLKAITLGEGMARGALTSGPYPGTLLIESLAQLGGFVAEAAANAGAPPPSNRGAPPLDGAGWSPDTASAAAGPAPPPRRALLVAVRRARLNPPRTPGAVVELECRLLSSIGDWARVSAEARWEGRVAARAELTYALRSDASEEVHAQRRALYRIWTGGLIGAPPLR